MNYFDDEERIIDWFQNHPHSKIGFVDQSEDVVSMLESIHEKTLWKNWINTSAKDQPPPDFYNEQLGLMMEVMRIDDHAFEKNGKLINPVNMRESRIQKELNQSGILDQFPNVKIPFVNAITNLPTAEDHNYTYYYQSFSRTVAHHISKINLYRENHPGYKLIFFIMDESSGYVKVNDKKLAQTGIKQGQPFKGQAHYWFNDRRFIQIFINSGIDYVIWYAPFKTTPEMAHIIDLSLAIVFDLKSITLDNTIDYPIEYMMSIEE